MLTVWYDSALDDGTHEPCAGIERETLETTSDGIDQAEPRSLECEVGLDFVGVHVVGDVLENLVRFWADRALGGVGMAGHVADSEAGSGHREWAWKSRRTSEGRLHERDGGGRRVDACERGS